MALIDDAEIDDGIELWDPDDFDGERQRIFDGVRDELSQTFPASYGGVRVEVDELDYEGPDHYSLADQKKALLSNKYLARKLRGTVRLRDEATGDVLEEKRLSLMRVPYLTPRGTFIHGGNEYTAVKQARLLSGPYTRRQQNGGLETQFNPRPGTGRMFRVALEPETGQFRLRVGGSNLHLYSLLKDIGYTDEQLEQRWGPELLAINAGKYDPRVFAKAFDKLVQPRDREAAADHEGKAKAIRAAFERFQMNAEVTRKNLPNLMDRTKSASWAMEYAAQVLGSEVAAKRAAEMEFLPDLNPTQAEHDLHWFEGWDLHTKQAAVRDLADFEPDLDADDMQEAYDAIYGKTKPQLASMERWPAEWLPPGSDQLGWINWYMGFANGQRTDDDERQIRRWKQFKARHGAQFRSNPTPRRAFALRNWAIDPLKLLDRPADRKRLAAEMEQYRQRETEKWLVKHATFGLDALLGLAHFLNREHGAGIDVTAPAAELETQILAFVSGQGVDPGLAGFAQQAYDQAHADVQEMHKAASEDTPPLQALLEAKQFSDQRRYSAKHAILAGLMRDQPAEFEIDSQDGDIVGITHLPTNFQIHVPRRYVPVGVRTRKPDLDPHAQQDRLEPRNPVTWVDRSALDSIRRHGLLSSEAMLKNPEVLESVARSRGRTIEQQREEIEKGLKSWRGESLKGPNVLFSLPPATLSLPGDHPTQQRDMVPVEIQLDALMRDRPDTYLHGSELVPYDKDTSDRLGKAYADLRHRALKQEEVAKLRQMSAEELWRHFDGEGGLYAANVPHATIHTQDGRIDPRYLTFGHEKAAVVEQRGDKWVLLTKDRSRVLGTHDTPDAAYRQEYAIQKSEERRAQDRDERLAKAASIAVDLDGTLAHSDPDGNFDPNHIGDPIPSMLKKVRRWLEEGKEVVLFTARASDPANIPPVRRWLDDLGLESVKITNQKTPDMEAFWDDRAHRNEGPADEPDAERGTAVKAKGRFLLQDELRMWAHVADDEFDPAPWRAKLERAGLEADDIEATMERFMEARRRELAKPAGTRWEEMRQRERAWTEEPKSQAQAEAGNYRKGTFQMRGLRFTIESAKGKKRRGWDSEGNITWEVTMQDDYGYVLGTKSERDEDHIDVFLGPDLGSEVVYCVDQINQKTGAFDEHKFVLGAHSPKDARQIYLRNFSPGWKCGQITPLTWPQFREWVMEGDTSKSLTDTSTVPLP